MKQLCYLVFSSSLLLVPFKGADAKSVMLHESVTQALACSPRLRAVSHEKDAVKQDLSRMRRRYGPSIDVLLGYGVEQYSDKTTRQDDADPSDTEWSSRGDAVLQLSQPVYDGGETGKSISVYKSKLSTIEHEYVDAVQETTMNAISAHLNVYRYRERVALAENDYNVHQDIFRSLETMEKAGAGNVADVSQTQTRMVRAQSSLFLVKGDLKRAISNYLHLVGDKPRELYFSDVPTCMPISEEEALAWMRAGNPALLAFDARFEEAAMKVDLARSEYRPKINFEVNSRYYDQMDGDPSWQQSNDAMLVLRWNLFNGGQDTAATRAALARKYESRSRRDGKLTELQDTISATWATYMALKAQKQAISKAVASSEKTFNVYLEQFGVAKRSLVDVLNAEREYFQSAGQLIDTSVDEVLAAYRILRLTGKLQGQAPAMYGSVNTKLSRLVKALHLPPAMVVGRTADAEAVDLPETQTVATVEAAPQTPVAPSIEPRRDAEKRLRLKIGPFATTDECLRIKGLLDRLGVAYQESSGLGKVRFTRLLEGVYTPEAARRRMAEIKPVTKVFTLPENNRVRLYVGSFHDQQNAKRYADHLADRAIEATLVDHLREIEGPMLETEGVEQKALDHIEDQLSAFGLSLEKTSG